MTGFQCTCRIRQPLFHTCARISDVSSDYSARAHYDRVTEAWGLLLGDELHWGYFASPDQSLSSATLALTDLMIEHADLEEGLAVLDVGCGTGTPALRLASEFGVRVLGITTSEVGVAAATQRAAGSDLVSFEVRDGMANALPEASFDRVWVMESSHLMADRQALISECARVLRPGGRMVLCDLIKRRDISFAEVRTRREDFAVLRAAFGAARMDSLEQYADYATQAGLTPHTSLDITDETLPTLDRWQENLDMHRTEVIRLIGEDGAADFGRSIEVLREFWTDQTLGYGLFSATRD